MAAFASRLLYRGAYIMPGSSKNAVLVRDTYYKEPIAKHLKKHLLLVRYVHAVGIPAVDTHYELINNPFAQLLYAVLPARGCINGQTSVRALYSGLAEAEHKEEELFLRGQPGSFPCSVVGDVLSTFLFYKRTT